MYYSFNENLLNEIDINEFNHRLSLYIKNHNYSETIFYNKTLKTILLSKKLFTDLCNELKYSKAKVIKYLIFQYYDIVKASNIKKALKKYISECDITELDNNPQDFLFYKELSDDYKKIKKDIFIAENL